MPGPGEYRPDPSQGITRIEDLPKPKIHGAVPISASRPRLADRSATHCRLATGDQCPDDYAPDHWNLGH